jgi:hypothetical protein
MPLPALKFDEVRPAGTFSVGSRDLDDAYGAVQFATETRREGQAISDL